MDAIDDKTIVRPGANGGGQALERVGFGSHEIEVKREMQGAALAARAQAEVQARCIVAMQRPRNLMQVRVRVLEHCKRPGFAVRAEYAKPVGGNKVRGPSIRFVETALQEYGNVMPSATVIYDDDIKRIIRVSVSDLERNVTYDDEAIVEKFVERKAPKDGDEVLGSRRNSYGDVVFKIRATEDDFANKCAAAVSKKTRNLGLRILPADIVDEAMFVAKQTRETQNAQDPASARRQLVDAFVELRVMPIELDNYLGHPFDQASPAEMDDLRGAYAAVRDGDTTWAALVEFQREQRGEVKEASKAAEAAGEVKRSKMDDIKAKLAEKKSKAAAAAPPPTADAKPPAPAPASDAPTADIPPTRKSAPAEPKVVVSESMRHEMTEEEKREALRREFEENS